MVIYICDMCGHEEYDNFLYCPNCGLYQSSLGALKRIEIDDIEDK